MLAYKALVRGKLQTNSLDLLPSLFLHSTLAALWVGWQMGLNSMSQCDSWLLRLSNKLSMVLQLEDCFSKLRIMLSHRKREKHILL